MAIDSFQGSSISSTYNRLVQTDGTVFADGTGSVIDLINITSSTAVSASYALTASYAVSASYEIIKEESSSFADTASYVNPLNQDVIVTGSSDTTLNLQSQNTSNALAVYEGGILRGNIKQNGTYKVGDLQFGRTDATSGEGITNPGTGRVAINARGSIEFYADTNNNNTNNVYQFKTRGNDAAVITWDGNVGIGTSNPNHRLDISGSVGIYKSGSTVLNVEGSSGQLFSITDSLTGSLFSVNTVAGLPVVEAFSDNTVNIGKFGVYPIKVVDSGSSAVITGSLFGTASYVPTLDEVTTAGNTTTNDIEVGGLTVDTDLIYTNTVSNLVGINTSSPQGSLTIYPGAPGTYEKASIHFGNSTRGASNLFNYISLSSNGRDLVYNAGFNLNAGYGHRFVADSTSADLMYIQANGNVLIGTTTDSGYKLDVNGTTRIKGSGTTSATTAFRVENANASASLVVLDDQTIILSGDTTSPTGNPPGGYFTTTVYDGRDTYSLRMGETMGNDLFIGSSAASSYFLSIQPNRRVRIGHYSTGTGNIEIGYNGTTNIIRNLRPTHFTSGSYVTGSLEVTGSTQLYKSGSTVLDVQGSQGQLFSVIDELSGSLMSVNDISGLPILEVFSDDRVEMGTYGAPALVVTGSDVNINSGSLNVQGQQLDAAFIWFMG